MSKDSTPPPHSPSGSAGQRPQTGQETVQRILDVAEVLFAEKGFAETSLRAITSQAGVNLAAVNYHFGGKEALIQSVFQRALAPFAKSLEVEMQTLPDGASLEQVMALLERVGGELFTRNPQKAINFLRLCALAYTQAQGHLRQYLTEQYGDIHKQFLKALSQTLPGLSPAELYWRVHFGLGALFFTLSGLEPLRAICKAEYQKEMSYEEISQRLMAFISAGIRNSVVNT